MKSLTYRYNVVFNKSCIEGEASIDWSILCLERLNRIFSISGGVLHGEEFIINFNSKRLPVVVFLPCHVCILTDGKDHGSQGPQTLTKKQVKKYMYESQ